MKFIGPNQIDCLLQSALQMTHKSGNNLPENHKAISTKVEEHIENNSQDSSLWEHPDDQAVIHLRNFAHSVGQSKHTEADVHSKAFESVVSKSNFPWTDVKQNFNSLQANASNKMYKDWKALGKNIKDYSVVKHKIKPDAKVAIIGDWGTGTEDAIQLLDQLLGHSEKPDVILHLGDIYQSCTQQEMEDNFLTPFNNAFKKANYRVPVYSIPGNHDYFAGGQPFYDMLNKINQPLGDDYLQEASYFCLQATDNSWQFLGADTGINDPDSYPRVSAPAVKSTELQWHKDKLQRFPGKTFFMTHHPVIEATYSLSHTQHHSLNPMNISLLKQFGSEFATANSKGNIDLWFWGHDHYFVPFKSGIPYGQTFIPKGRLLGGSARETHDIQKNSHGRIKNQHLFETDSNGDLILPNHNNSYINHTWCLVNLGTQKIQYFQTPAWTNDFDKKTLPSGQKFMFFEEDM